MGGAQVEARVAGATCLGDVLQAQGYRTVYLGGASLAFGNKDEFLAEHGFDDRYGRRRLQPEVRDASQTSILGVRDDFLFAFALDKLAALSERAGLSEHARLSEPAAAPPFALVLLTLDAHGPYGSPSASCGPNTGEGLLFAIRCADRMLARARLLAGRWARYAGLRTAAQGTQGAWQSSDLVKTGTPLPWRLP